MNDVTAIIKRHQVRPAGKRMVGVPIVPDGAEPDPLARIIQQDGRAVAIEVTCVCGKRMYLELDCGDAAAPAPREAKTEDEE